MVWWLVRQKKGRTKLKHLRDAALYTYESCSCMFRQVRWLKDKGGNELKMSSTSSKLVATFAKVISITHHFALQCFNWTVMEIPYVAEIGNNMWPYVKFTIACVFLSFCFVLICKVSFFNFEKSHKMWIILIIAVVYSGGYQNRFQEGVAIATSASVGRMCPKQLKLSGF